MPLDVVTGSDAPVEAPKQAEKSGFLASVDEVFTQAADAAKKVVQHYKDGGKSGITDQFGKPLIFDGARRETPEKLVPGIDKPVLDFADDVPRTRDAKEGDAKAVEAKSDAKAGDGKPAEANAEAHQPAEAKADGKAAAPVGEPVVAKVEVSADGKSTKSTMTNGDELIEYEKGSAVKSQYTFKESGAVVTEYPNGDKSTELPKENMDIMEFAKGGKRTEWKNDGVIQETMPNGDVVTIYEKEKLTQIEYAKGEVKRQTVLENGDTQTEYRNGDRVDESHKTGTKMTVKADDTVILEAGDKSFKSIKHPDNSWEVIEKNKTTTWKDGVKTTSYKNGQTVVEDSQSGQTLITNKDGCTTTITKDGHFIRRDKNGKELESGMAA